MQTRKYYYVVQRMHNSEKDWSDWDKYDDLSKARKVLNDFKSDLEQCWTEYNFRLIRRCISETVVS